MKYTKILLLASAIALIAAGCNKKAADNQNTDTNTTQQNQQQSTDQNQQAVNTPTTTTPTTPQATTIAPGGNLEGDLHFSGESDVMSEADSQVFQIDMNKAGFYPTSLHVKSGDYVQFVTKDDTKHWPASDPHPTHTALPGFDAKKALGNGEKYTFQFTKKGTWGFHDHLNPGFKGSIVVE